MIYCILLVKSNMHCMTTNFAFVSFGMPGSRLILPSCLMHGGASTWTGPYRSNYTQIGKMETTFNLCFARCMKNWFTEVPHIWSSFGCHYLRVVSSQKVLWVYGLAHLSYDICLQIWRRVKLRNARLCKPSFSVVSCVWGGSDIALNSNTLYHDLLAYGGRKALSDTTWRSPTFTIHWNNGGKPGLEPRIIVFLPATFHSKLRSRRPLGHLPRPWSVSCSS